MKDFLKAVIFAGLFAVPFLTLYVENDYFFPFITGKNFWFRIIIDVVFASWVILALYDAKYRPKFSGVLASFGVLLVVMFFANLFGKHPSSSFFSNFERMDGYVSLVHTFLYALVLGSMLVSKSHWKYLLNTSLVVAALVSINGLSQYLGAENGGVRIDSTLGNAAYMAIYMLFHIFIAFWMIIDSKSDDWSGWVHKAFYLALAALFTFVLVQTGTRGTAIGLVAGIGVMSGYIAFFAAQFKQYRKYAVGLLGVLVLTAGVLVVNRDAEFIQSNPNLSRIANISLDDLTIRSIIWGMAWDGVKEEPLLGYGQSNFNYVFNENYDPRLYAQEQWFDRTHNIFLDWLVAGGFLGLIAYLGIFAWCGWYLLVRPLVQKNDDAFTALERGVLLGILAGYFVHNLVVFDNIVSYIFFAIILGLIHSRVGSPFKSIQNAKVDTAIITQFAAPIMAVLLVAVIYFVHAPGMSVAGRMIDALRAENLEVRLDTFVEILDSGTFAQQEVTEQLAQQAMSLARNQQVPADIREAYLQEAEARLLQLAEDKPDDARVHVFIGSYYRSMGNNDAAAEQMAIARELSPNKQTIIVQQGFVDLSRENNETAVDFFETAFTLDEQNLEAREYYAASLFYVDRGDEAIALMNTPEAEQRFAASEFIISSANQFGRQDLMIDLYEIRVASEPTAQQNWRNEAQNWATLAFLYYEEEQTQEAVQTLQRAQEQIPDFEPTASCIADNIQNNREPQEGC